MNAPTSRSLRRSSGDRVVLGLCSGLARTVDLPVAAVRVGVLVATLLAPSFVITAYAVGALIVPRDDGRALLGGTPATGRDVVFGWGLALVAGVYLLGNIVNPFDVLRSVSTDPYTFVHDVGYENARLLVSAPILLFAIGVGLWLALRRPSGQAVLPPPPTATGEQPTVVIPEPVGTSVAPYGIGGVTVVFAVVAALTATGAISLTTGAIAVLLAAGAAICGVAAIALNAKRGAPALLGLAVILAGATIVMAALPSELRGRVGARTVQPVGLSDLQSSYRQGIGSLDLDLRDVDLPTGVTRVTAAVGYGSLNVHVPSGVRVESTGPTYVNGADDVGANPKKFKRPVLLLAADVRYGGTATIIRDGP